MAVGTPTRQSSGSSNISLFALATGARLLRSGTSQAPGSKPDSVAKSSSQSSAQAPAIALPTGGGAIRVIDEKLQVNPATGAIMDTETGQYWAFVRGATGSQTSNSYLNSSVRVGTTVGAIGPDDGALGFQFPVSFIPTSGDMVTAAVTRVHAIEIYTPHGGDIQNMVPEPSSVMLTLVSLLGAVAVLRAP